MPLVLALIVCLAALFDGASASYDARRKFDLVGDLDGQGANEGRDYGYDANGRLVSALGPWGASGAQVSRRFKYDALGNLREQVLGARVITVNYQAAKNRVTSAVDNGVTRTYTHDVRGNATTAGGLTFTYDHSNQPTAVSGSAAATYVYDGNLKRVKEVRGGKTYYTIFSKVTGGLIYRFEDATGAANDIRTDYVNAGGAALRLKKTGTATVFVPEYTHFDSQGSAVAATDAAGTSVLWRERYAPFGQELLNPAANADNTGYTGHLKDDATGLNYMQARYYDPIIGRFLSTDPIGYRDQLNLYAYVGNDPLNSADPSGLAGEDPKGDGGCAGFISVNPGGECAEGDSSKSEAFLAEKSGRNIRLGPPRNNLACVRTGNFGCGATPDQDQIFTNAACEGGACVGAVLPMAIIAGVVVRPLAGLVLEGSGTAGFAGLSQAGRFGGQSYGNLTTSLRGTGLQAHHLLEKRFAGVLGQTVSQMSSIAVTKAEHTAFTNAWRAAIPYGSGTANATQAQVLDAARNIYSNYPAILAALGL